MVERTEEREKTREELKEAVKPLVDFLYNHYDPHTRIIVDEEGAEVLCGDMCIKNILRD
jgi:hypothetical protein